MNLLKMMRITGLVLYYENFDFLYLEHFLKVINFKIFYVNISFLIYLFKLNLEKISFRLILAYIFI